MERIQGGPIYSIGIGNNPKDLMTWAVGKQWQTPDGNTVVIDEILRDENNFFFFGNLRYLVYVKNKDGDRILWRSYENCPITVTYNI